MSVNKVILVGRLGTDPELRYTPSGAAVCNFSLATSEVWNDKNTGQKNEKTEWHRIVVWGKQAEHCNNYLGKGRQAYIEGRLQTRSWDDKDGNKRYTTEIISNVVQFIGSRNDAPANMGAPQEYTGTNQASTSNQPVENFDIKPDSSFAADDIPF